MSHHHHHHHHEQQHRSRTSSSRSCSGGRERERDRDRERSSHERRERSSSREDRQRRHSEDTPYYEDDYSQRGASARDRDHHGYGSSRGGRFPHRAEDEDRETSLEATNVIMLRGLNPTTTQEKLTDVIKAYGPVEDVRLIRDRETGESRGFAFADFPSVGEAQAFLDYHKGTLHLDERAVNLTFSRQRREPPAEHRDWICPQCQGSNFARRVACYMCNAARPAHPQFVANEETQKEEASTVLAVRGLDTLTTETTLYTVFASFGAVKEIRLIRDKHTNVSRGFCFVEYYTLEETKYALENSIQLRIDGQLVRCSFARGNEREGPPFKKGRKREERTGGPQHVANAALEQAQWAIQNQGAGQLPFYHQPVSTQTAVKPAGLDTSSVGQSGIGANLVAFPVPEGFEFDQSSGYYYSAQTGYYYDSTTGYYYDSSSGTYYYYDVASQSYVVVDNTTTPTPSSSTSTSTSSSTTPATSTTLAMETSSATTGVDTSTDSKISFSIQVPAIGQQTEKTTQGKAKKPKTKTIRAKKVSKELERWNKKNMELQQQLEEEQQQREPKLKFQLSAVNTATPAADGPARAEIGESAGIAHQNQNEDIKGTVGSHDTVSQTVSPLGVASSSSMLDLGQLFGSICLLCRRKFASPDAMAEHVDRSKLHQQNLEIAREKEVKQLKELTKQQNMLRAKAESQKERKKKRKRKDETILPTTSATAMAVNSLGDTNIGNQMLRKMGWEAGKGLGKDGDGITAPIQVTQRAERAGLGAPSLNPEHTIEAGDSYQKAALKKARARLDALMG